MMELAVWIGLAVLVYIALLLRENRSLQSETILQMRGITGAIDDLRRQMIDHDAGPDERVPYAIEELQQFLGREFEAQAAQRAAFIEQVSKLQIEMDSLRSDLEQRHQTIESIERQTDALDRHFNPSHDDDDVPSIFRHSR